MPKRIDVVSLTIEPKIVKILDDLARQSFRSRSAMIRFLVIQEYERQIAAVNSLPAPVVYPQKGE
jgi:predicted transcriptional regulator